MCHHPWCEVEEGRVAHQAGRWLLTIHEWKDFTDPSPQNSNNKKEQWHISGYVPIKNRNCCISCIFVCRIKNVILKCLSTHLLFEELNKVCTAFSTKNYIDNVDDDNMMIIMVMIIILIVVIIIIHLIIIFFCIRWGSWNLLLFYKKEENSSTMAIQ